MHESKILSCHISRGVLHHTYTYLTITLFFVITYYVGVLFYNVVSITYWPHDTYE